MAEQYVVTEIMLSMLMSITGSFRSHSDAMKYANRQNKEYKLKCSKLKRSVNTLYQVWPLRTWQTNLPRVR